MSKVPFIADRGYDAVGLIERLKEFGCKPAIKVKENFRMKITKSLRKYGMEDWMVYGEGEVYSRGVVWDDKA